MWNLCSFCLKDFLTLVCLLLVLGEGAASETKGILSDGNPSERTRGC